MKREVSTILRNARAMIHNKDRWTRGALARNEQGKSVDPDSNQACQWCAIGAVMSSIRTFSNKRTPRYLTQNKVAQISADLGTIIRESTSEVAGIEECNDRLGHTAVLAIFDEAIRRAEIEETRGW